MQTIQYIGSKTSLTGSIVIKEEGEKTSYTASTASTTKVYKTLKGAQNFMVKSGYMVYNKSEPTYKTELEYQQAIINILNNDDFAKKQLKIAVERSKEIEKTNPEMAKEFYEKAKYKIITFATYVIPEVRELNKEMIYHLLREEIQPIEKA